MTGYRDLSRNRDFTILWTGQTISDLGSQVSTFVFPLITYALTGSAMWAAVVEAAFLLGMCAALLPAGVLADRVDRRLLMRTASGAGVVLYSSLAVAGALGALTIPHLAVVALLTGVASGLSGPSEMSAIRSVVRREDLSTALSQSQARQHIASLVGGPLGGILYGVTRWLPFAFDAISFAVSWVLLGRLRTDLSAPKHDGPRRKPHHDVVEGIRFILGWPYFRALAVWGALTNLLVNAMFFVAILRMIQEGVSPAVIGLVAPPRASAASSARSPHPGSSSGWRPACSSSPSPGASFRSSCRWCCGATRPWWPRRSSPACCSTRPATPAAAPTGSRTPPRTSRAGHSRPRSSCRCR